MEWDSVTVLKAFIIVIMSFGPFVVLQIITKKHKRKKIKDNRRNKREEHREERKETYYDILCVSPTVSMEEIRSAYRKMALQYHPDVYRGDTLVAEEKMKKLNEVYSRLSNPESRSAYDRELLLEYAQVGAASEKTPKRRHINVLALIFAVLTAFSVGLCVYMHSKTKAAELRKNFAEQRIEWKILQIEDLNKKLKSYKSENENLTSRINKLEREIDILLYGYTSGTEKTDSSTSPKKEIVIDRVPYTGEILEGNVYPNGSQIKVTGSSDADCVVKLKNISGDTVVSFYVRSDETATVGVPAELMYVYFASGDTWLGTSKLFGELTYYSKDENLLDFTKYTWEYTLVPRTDGNFTETPVDASEFW